MRGSAFGAAASVLITLALCAAATQAADITTPIQLVAYKHGYGFVLAEGRGTATDGWVTTSQVPQASLGTFWLYSTDEGVRVDRAVTEESQGTESATVQTYDDLLRANIGSEVDVRLTEGRTVEGTLAAVLPALPPAASPNDPVSSLTRPEYAYRYNYYGPSPVQPSGPVTHLVVQAGEETVTLSVGTIVTVRFGNEPPKEFARPAREKRLSAHLLRGDEPVSGDVSLGMGYMAKGVRWIPTYAVHRDGDGTVRLRLHATFINEAVSLADTTVHFAVGVPNFIQQDVVSPLSLETAWTGLSSYFAQIAPQDARRRDAFSNAMMTQSAMMGGGMVGGEGAVYNPLDASAIEAADVSGAGADEMFFYRIDHVTMIKGARGTFSLLDTRVPVEDVYLWDILQGVLDYREDGGRPNERLSPEELAAQLAASRVWHALRLTNDTQVPWTTGPALSMVESKPVGQDLLRYTPPGAKADLKTTVAPDILAESTESETARQRDAMAVHGIHYDLVTVEGKLHVSNHKSEAVRLSARRELQGELIRADADPQARMVARKLTFANPTTELVWDLTVEPQQARDITYQYRVYVRQ